MAQELLQKGNSLNKYKMMEWTDENIKKFWDYESNLKENYFTYQVGDKVVEYLHSYLSDKKNILDFGCGAGYLIEHLLKIGLEVYGLDFSDKSIEKVNEKYRNDPLFKGAFTMGSDMNNVNKFDSIIATEVIEHLDDNKLKSTMNFIKNSLTDNGIAIFTTPNDEDLSKSMVYCPEAECVFHRWQHVRSWTEESLRTYLLLYFREVETFTLDLKQYGKEKNISLREKIKRLLGLSKKVDEIYAPNLIAIVKK